MHSFSLPRFFILSVIGCLLLSTSTALAGDSALKITDCQGQMRLSQKLSEVETVQLAFRFSEPVKESLTLSPRDFIDATKKGKPTSDMKTVVFKDVSVGSWSLCGPDGELVNFNSVDVLSGSTNTASARVGILGTSVIAAGAAAIAIGSSSSGSSSSSDDRGGAGSLNNDPIESPVASVIAPGVSSASNFDDDDYSFGASASPLSPFS